MEPTLVRITRSRASAIPAVLVATRLIGTLGQSWRVDLHSIGDDEIVLRVRPAALEAAPAGRTPGRLAAELAALLRADTFAGWESDPDG